MTNTTSSPTGMDDDLQRLFATIPRPDQIRERIAQNSRETSVLKRLLKLAEDAELARGAISPLNMEGANNDE